jgi:hypothetical protein
VCIRVRVDVVVLPRRSRGTKGYLALGSSVFVF